MKGHTDIRKELESMGSPLAALPRMMPYSVPQGYFDGLGKGIMDIVKENEGEATLSAGKAMPYTGIPAGYFGQLPEKMLALAKAETADKPQLINLTPTRKHTLSIRKVQWAVAAIFVIMVGIGSYTFFFKQSEPGADKLLSSVPNNELHEYLQSTCRIDVDMVVNNNAIVNLQLDNKDIISYLDETGWDVVD